ncbi:MAG: FkbM family methyltransferase [Candidatus Neomarinimicrobiota bacterium]
MNQFFFWFKDNAEILLYEHDLNQNSIVIDAGAYEGNWSSKIYGKYQCNIFAYEPVKKHFLVLKEKMKIYKKIKVYNYGVGKIDQSIGVTLKGVQTSAVNQATDPDEIIKIKSIDKVEELKSANIDLFHINIEGGEYDLLVAIIESSMVKKIKVLEVQFHEWYPTLKSSKNLREKIHQQLSNTHQLVYSYDFVWEQWSRIT